MTTLQNISQEIIISDHVIRLVVFICWSSTLEYSTEIRFKIWIDITTTSIFPLRMPRYSIFPMLTFFAVKNILDVPRHVVTFQEYEITFVFPMMESPPTKCASLNLCKQPQSNRNRKSIWCRIPRKGEERLEVHCISWKLFIVFHMVSDITQCKISTECVGLNISES